MDNLEIPSCQEFKLSNHSKLIVRGIGSFSTESELKSVMENVRSTNVTPAILTDSSGDSLILNANLTKKLKESQFVVLELVN